MKYQESIIEKAIELAKANISSSSEWTPPETVIDFIDKMIEFLSGKYSVKA